MRYAPTSPVGAYCIRPPWVRALHAPRASRAWQARDGLLHSLGVHACAQSPQDSQRLLQPLVGRALFAFLGMRLPVHVQEPGHGVKDRASSASAQAVQALHQLTMITLQGNVCCLGSGTVAHLPQVERCLLVRVAAVVAIDRQPERRLPPLAPRTPQPRAAAIRRAIPRPDQPRPPRESGHARTGKHQPPPRPGGAPGRRPPARPAPLPPDARPRRRAARAAFRGLPPPAL